MIKPHEAYWIGFMLADGCIIEGKNNTQDALQLKLHERDFDHLRKFLLFLGVKNKIHHYPDREECVVKVYDQKWVDWFKEHGVIPRKTLVAKAYPSVRRSRDFYRGVFDGDGSLGRYSDTLHFEFYATLDVCQGLCDFLQDELSITLEPKLKEGILYRVRATGGNAVAILDWLYQDGDTYLERKERKFANNVI